ncbi:GntR family transcriptional regulator [Singulisphaera sp. PoT]|uniref:GntR family transcriptional regulator n=1 Tax=Singulisphaera sp. PoT TaxID=3411797 RepID=UPI003BF4BB2B
MSIPSLIVGTSNGPISRGNLRQQVTSRILAAVFQGSFESGQRLVVQRLSELYEVSPTPVREALVELAALGIVELLPNRGAVVLPFGPQQVREISQIRRVLEAEGTRCACGRIPDADLQILEAEFKQLGARPADEQRDHDARNCDNKLHGLISISCGSARLTAEIDRYLTLFRTLRDVSHLRDAATNYSRSDDVWEHLDVVVKLRELDADGAARAMDHHIRSASLTLEEVLFTTQDNGPLKEGVILRGVGPSPGSKVVDS